MTTETIHNPNLLEDTCCWKDFRPVFSHFDVEHHPPLLESDNPVIDHLLKTGFEIHETVTTFYKGFPTRGFKLDRHFLTNVRDEFQIRLGDDGWLQFRFETKNTVFLTLFYILPEKQQHGRGRYWFPRVCDALFRAGVWMLNGEVAPAYYPSRTRMDKNRLLGFYVREAGFQLSEDGLIFRFSPYVGGSTEDSPNSQDTEIRNASQTATIS